MQTICSLGMLQWHELYRCGAARILYRAAFFLVITSPLLIEFIRHLSHLVSIVVNMKFVTAVALLASAATALEWLPIVPLHARQVTSGAKYECHENCGM